MRRDRRVQLNGNSAGICAHRSPDAGVDARHYSSPGSDHAIVSPWRRILSDAGDKSAATRIALMRKDVPEAELNMGTWTFSHLGGQSSGYSPSRGRPAHAHLLFGFFLMHTTEPPRPNHTSSISRRIR